MALTESEELELLELEELEAASGAKPDAPKQEKSPALQRAVNLGATYMDARSLGLGPKIGAAVGTLPAKAVAEGIEAFTGNEAPSIKDIYKSGVDLYSGFGKQAFKDDPVLAVGASLAGGLKTAKDIGTTKIAQKAADWAGRGGLGKRVLKGGALASVGGAVYGAGSSEVGDELAGAAKGAATGFGLGAAMPAVGATVSKLNTKVNIPNADKIKEAASKSYEKARQFGGEFKPEFTNKFLVKAQKALLSNDEIINAMRSNKPLADAFDDLAAFKDQPMSLERAQALDEQLSNMVDGFVDNVGNITKAGKKILDAQAQFRHMIETADDSLLNGTKEGFEALKEGRKLWAASRRLYDIERIIENASTYQVPATAIKSGFRRLKNSSKILGYSPEEAKAIERAANTGIATDIMATFGSRLAPLVGMTQGPGGALLGYAGATLSREGATASQVSRANAAARAVAERSGMVTEKQRLAIPTMREILNMPPAEAKKLLSGNLAKP